MSKLMENGEKTRFCLTVNEKNTKYMLYSQDCGDSYLNVDNYKFEENKFQKYLELNEGPKNYEEIQLR